MSNTLSRREFLQTTIITSAAGVAVLSAACNSPKSANEAGGDKAEQPVAAGGGCDDLTGLTDADKAARTGLKYVDVTTMPDKKCDNCQLYVAAEAGKSCGTCKVVKGPIAPAGYCTAWAKKA